MKLFPVFNLHESKDIRKGGRSLPDWYIRAVLGEPKAGEWEKQQASYSAQALEEDREASDDT